jgi:hypothetical protein
MNGSATFEFWSLQDLFMAKQKTREKYDETIEILNNSLEP